MQGTLNEIDVRSILQLVELGQRTGELLVEAYSPAIAPNADTAPIKPADQPFWFVFFANGRIVYIADRHNNSLSRLRDYLRCYDAAAALDHLERPSPGAINAPEYGYLWLLMENRTLTPEQGRRIIQATIEEALFDLFNLRQGSFNFELGPALAPPLVALEVSPLCARALKQVQQWKQLHPHIFSPAQRPVLADKPRLRALLPPKSYGSLSRWADGQTTLRQLSRYLDRSLWAIAKGIYPYVQRGWIQLLDAATPEVRDRRPWEDEPAARIACIDDDRTISKSIEAMLTPYGYEIASFADPLAALPEVFRFEPDLLLCDIAMPHLDGYEFCAMLRSSSAFRQTPIIMLTGRDGFIDRVRARMAGATDYLTKPFGAHELLMLFEKHLPTVPHRRHLESTPPT
ncbi:MAG: response regulator [Spirulinaceae cyanobacterium RM2_2_10]|nr:response regulator [Spirulinaceae cyanobacterium SM2_1_0]NJO20966.1 response regulator [Spirulinaceae cyanobacterium RM2_2_10]